jgi:hypothetical protein
VKISDLQQDAAVKHYFYCVCINMSQDKRVICATVIVVNTIRRCSETMSTR